MPRSLPISFSLYVWFRFWCLSATVVCIEVDLRRDLAGNFQDKSMTHRFNAFSFFLNNKKKDEFLSVVNLGIFPNIFFYYELFDACTFSMNNIESIQTLNSKPKFFSFAHHIFVIQRLCKLELYYDRRVCQPHRATVTVACT